MSAFLEGMKVDFSRFLFWAAVALVAICALEGLSFFAHEAGSALSTLTMPAVTDAAGRLATTLGALVAGYLLGYFRWQQRYERVWRDALADIGTRYAFVRSVCINVERTAILDPACKEAAGRAEFLREQIGIVLGPHKGVMSMLAERPDPERVSAEVETMLRMFYGEKK